MITNLLCIDILYHWTYFLNAFFYFNDHRFFNYFFNNNLFYNFNLFNDLTSLFNNAGLLSYDLNRAYFFLYAANLFFYINWFLDLNYPLYYHLNCYNFRHLNTFLNNLLNNPWTFNDNFFTNLNLYYFLYYFINIFNIFQWNMNNFFNFFIFSLINDFLYDPIDRNNSGHFYAPFYDLLNYIRDFNSFVVNRTAVYNHVDINAISKLIVNHSNNSSVYTYVNACIRLYSSYLI